MNRSPFACVSVLLYAVLSMVSLYGTQTPQQRAAQMLTEKVLSMHDMRGTIASFAWGPSDIQTLRTLTLVNKRFHTTVQVQLTQHAKRYAQLFAHVELLDTLAQQAATTAGADLKPQEAWLREGFRKLDVGGTQTKSGLFLVGNCLDTPLGTFTLYLESANTINASHTLRFMILKQLTVTFHGMKYPQTTFRGSHRQSSFNGRVRYVTTQQDLKRRRVYTALPLSRWYEYTTHSALLFAHFPPMRDPNMKKVRPSDTNMLNQYRNTEVMIFDDNENGPDLPAFAVHAINGQAVVQTPIYYADREQRTNPALAQKLWSMILDSRTPRSNERKSAEPRTPQQIPRKLLSKRKNSRP